MEKQNADRLRAAINFLPSKLERQGDLRDPYFPEEQSLFRNRITNNINPIESLSVEEIKSLQIYLENIKNKKLKSGNLNYDPGKTRFPSIIRETPIPLERVPQTKLNLLLSEQSGLLPRGGASTRTSRRLDFEGTCSMNNDQNTEQSGGINFEGMRDYVNPYEYGGCDNGLGPIYKNAYMEPNHTNIGATPNICGEQFPGHIRNINIESTLMQHETTHLPGQRRIMEKNLDRFEFLPFDPQDHRHIVWTDNMPRGGYSTRAERLELEPA